MSANELSAEHPPQEGFAARFRLVAASYASVPGLARAIGRSEGAVRKWMRGESEPNVSDLKAICEHTGTRVEWLVTGRGERQVEIAQIREDAATYETVRAPIDFNFLGQIMDAADIELQTTGTQVSSVKHSSMVVTLYQLFSDSRSIDRDTVARIVKLAA